MKKLLPLFTLLLFLNFVSAQTGSNIILNYDSIDEHYATENSYSYQRLLWPLNKYFPNTYNGTLKNAAVLFDSIVFINPNQQIQFYPKEQTTLSLDSFSLLFSHQNNSQTKDTITLTVFNRNSLVITGVGTPAAQYYAATLWDTTIITTTSLTGNGQSATMMFRPFLSLPQAVTFGIRVDFKGDTANRFMVAAGYRNECNNTCSASPAIISGGTIGYLNHTDISNQSGLYFSGQGVFYTDCNTDGNYNNNGCENHPFQNLAVVAYVAANTAITSNAQCSIIGYAFIDTDTNCLQNNNELPATGRTVLATKNNSVYYGLTNIAGRYEIIVPDTGTYSISVYNNPNICSQPHLCTDSIVTISVVGDSAINNNIAFSPSTSPDYSLLVLNSNANPGFIQNYTIYPFNYNGNSTNAAVTVTFTYDSSLTFLSGSGTLQHNTADKTITWTIDTLEQYVFSNQPLEVAFNVSPVLQANHVLHNTFSILPVAGDCNPDNNFFSISNTVSGSFDPNTKEVTPQGAITGRDSILTYTIHFQNTGNDTTHFVIITDTLSQYVEPGSVQTIAASHPYNAFTISAQGILTWSFNPLYLPDSATNETASKGFVTFTIKTKASLPIGTSINNRAAIYFDYNPPIITNTVTSTVAELLSVPALNNTAPVTVQVYPNPFSHKTQIAVTGINSTYNFELYDLTGRLAKNIPNITSTQFTLQRDDLAGGVYFYRIYSAGQHTNGRLVIE